VIIEVVTGLVGGCVGAAIAYSAVTWLRSSDVRLVMQELQTLDQRMTRLEMTERSQKGVAAREEKAAEFELAMAELLPIFQTEGDIQAKVAAALPILQKYPRVRAMVMKQFGL
jgi:hypothetical protein